jgi:hypothetical protein
MPTKLIPRTCFACGKGMGTVSMRYVCAGVWKRDYFHPTCFKRFLKDRK